MQLFTCPHCAATLYFDNARCVVCGTEVLYDPLARTMRRGGAQGVSACANSPPDRAGCNWTASEPGGFCRACELNQTIPDLSVAGNTERWSLIEAAKRRAVYSLLALGLEVRPKARPGDGPGIAFDFLADPPAGAGGKRVMTGHASGLITLNVAEADAQERERIRMEMGEPYRTLLGHFRHELGHYYWDRLVGASPALEACRTLFGDERADYAQALENHYRDGAPADWQDRFISPYAASHPWEDWAESWAHYLHITDTLETASAYAMAPVPPGAEGPERGEPVLLGAIGRFTMAELALRWRPLAVAVNALNRSMGLPDLYPFVLGENVVTKLAFVHDIVSGRR